MGIIFIVFFNMFASINYILVNFCLIDFYICLQGKRGIEKQPFQLPDFIAATGIEKIRQVRLSYSLCTCTPENNMKCQV